LKADLRRSQKALAVSLVRARQTLVSCVSVSRKFARAIFRAHLQQEKTLGFKPRARIFH
jgi:uncharacterized protein (DUF2344 family)